MKRNEVLRAVPGQPWRPVPSFDDLVEGIREAPPFKPKTYEYLRILNSPAIQQLVGNANVAAGAAQREAYMAQRSAMVQSVARETGIDASTLEEMRERRIAADEVPGGGWYPPPDDPYSRMRGTAGAGGGSEPPFGEEPQQIPPPSPKPRQPPGGGASVTSDSVLYFSLAVLPDQGTFRAQVIG